MVPVSCLPLPFPEFLVWRSLHTLLNFSLSFNTHIPCWLHQYVLLTLSAFQIRRNELLVWGKSLPFFFFYVVIIISVEIRFVCICINRDLHCFLLDSWSNIVCIACCVLCSLINVLVHFACLTVSLTSCWLCWFGAVQESSIHCETTIWYRSVARDQFGVWVYMYK